MANDEIGALNVRVGLDGTGFQEGISSINRQLAVAKSEFKLAAAQIADSGTAMDKVRLQTDSLSKQIEIQSQKVDTLSLAHQKSVESKGADVKATQDLEIKLNNAKTALAGMENELRASTAELELNATGFNGVSIAAERATLEGRNFGKSMEETKKGIELTRVAMLGFGAIMAGGMLAEWADGSEKMAISLQKLQIETGSSQQEVERLAVVASGAGVSTDQLATMIGKLDLRVSNATLGTKSFASGLNDLGINAQKFAEANLPEQASMIADAVQKSTMPTKQLDSALKNIGISAQNLGAAAKGNIDVISGSLARASQEGSTLGRALSQAGINMNTFAGADVETKLQILGKYFETTQDKAKATALVMQVFGKSGQDMLPLIQNFAELDGYAKQLKMPVMDTKDIQLAAEKTKMLQTAMQMMMDSVLVKLLPIVDSIGKAFYDLAANISNPANAVKNFVQDLGPVGATVAGLTIAFAGAKVAIALYETATKSLTIATALWSAVTRVASVAMIAFNAVMDANPIALVVIAVAALGVGIYELVKHWTVVREALSSGWTWMKNEATVIWGGITAFFKKWGVDLLAAFLPVIGLPILIALHWQQIVAVAQQVWGAVVDFVTGLWTGFVAWITGAAQAVADAVVGAFTWMYNHNYVVQALVDAVVKIWNDFASFISGLWNGIVGAAETVWNGFKAFFELFWKAEVAGWTMIWNAIKTAVSAIWNAIVTAAKAVFGPIASFFTGLWSGISGATSKAWNAIVSTLRGLWSGAVNTAEGIFNGLGTFFTGLWKDAENWGANLIHMFAQGVMSKVHEVEDAVKGVGKTISNFLGFHSPTEEGAGADADTWMPNLMNMLVEGVHKGAPKLQDALKRVIPGMDSSLTANMLTGAGAVLSRPKMVLAGDAGSGAALPLNDSVMSRLANAIAGAMPRGGGGGQPIIINLDGRQIASYTHDILTGQLVQDQRKGL